MKVSPAENPDPSKPYFFVLARTSEAIDLHASPAAGFLHNNFVYVCVCSCVRVCVWLTIRMRGLGGRFDISSPHALFYIVGIISSLSLSSISLTVDQRPEMTVDERSMTSCV